MIIKLSRTIGQPFYACEAHPKDHKEEVLEKQIMNIPRIKNMVCEDCDYSICVKNIPFKGVWLECSDSTACSYRRRIKFIG